MNKIFNPHERKQKALQILWIVFIAAAALCVWQIHTDRQSFFEGYFFGFLIVVSIPVGSLGIWLIHTLTGGAWGEPLKKYYRAVGATLPMAFVLGLPNLFWLNRLYEWSTLSVVMLGSKKIYLNVPFFMTRSLIYFAIWTGIMFWLVRFNHRWNLSGLLTVLYVLAGTFAGIDWVMSLDYHWYSTMFGILFVVGQALLSFCLLIVMYVFLENPTNISPENENRFRDMGNLVLTMVMLWAYMSFSQFLIIWMGNLPEEIRWYLPRTKGGWGIIAAGLIVGHFFIPFFLLLRRAWKKNPTFLAGIAGGIIFMRIIDIAWMVFPGLARSLSSLTPMHAIAAMLVVTFYFTILFKQIKTVG